MSDINIANSTYSKALQGLKNSTSSTSTNSGSSIFGDLVRNSLDSAIDAQYKSEQVSAAALVGQADMTDVIQAIGDAELALNTVIAVRDKVISAYESIINMSI